MRITLVAQWFPPIIGGEEWHVWNLGTELVRRGHEVSVATLHQPGLPPFEEQSGMRVHRLRGTVQRLGRLFHDPTRKSVAPIPDPELASGLQRVITAERPDVVHAHNWLVHPWLPMKPFSGRPLVVTLHDFSLVCARKDNMRLARVDCSGPGIAKCLRCGTDKFGFGKGVATVVGTFAMGSFERTVADRFIAVSRSVLEGNGLDSVGDRASIIPNFIPDDDTGQQSVPPTGLPEEPFLLYVGGISHVKGVPVLLRAYAGLEDAPPLVLIGYRGEETDRIIRDLPPRATYLSSQPRGAVLEAWRRSSLGIVPSICRDACPTVVLEAMAAGRPIVASRIGGIPDLIEDEVNGLLVTPNDAAELRAAISRVICDRALADRLAAAGRDRIQRFTASAVVPQIEQVYRDAMAR